MTISRVNGADWGIDDKLTTSQLNALDTNATYALDRRTGQTDTLASVVSCSGAGRLIPTVVTGADANTTYQVGGGNGVIQLTNAITAARAYALSATGAVTGDEISIYAESSNANDVTVKDQSSATMFVVGNSAAADGPWATFIYIGGWRLYRSGKAAQLRPTTFTSNGTLVVPAGVALALAIGYGGGAGGGSGYEHGSISTLLYQAGGGGGGGAIARTQLMAVTAGQTLTATIGAGGAGGTHFGPGGANAGQDGGSTTLANGVTTLTWKGAAAGFGGYFIAGGGNAIWVLGGQTIAPLIAANTYFSGITTPPGLVVAPSTGGFGRIRALNSGGTGGPSLEGYAGGAGGAGGIDDGAYAAGGGGGGGGAGPGGNGGAGGAGGDANSGAVGTAGAFGSAAALNSGAGGGGGGAPGMGSGGANLAGDGGTGGSGKLTLIWVK